jgi:hypothetical protein
MKSFSKCLTLNDGFVGFFSFFEPSRFSRLRGLRAVVVLPPDFGKGTARAVD